MSDASPFAFGKFIPGFDFLQQLASAQKAGSGIPGLGQWVAPTVSVEELDKRITELKAVQFWLDQNLTALKATIQALEVQKMTLATLQGMNVSMAEVAKAFTVPVPPPSAPAPVATPAAPAASSAAQNWPFDRASAGAKAPQAAVVEPQPVSVPIEAAPEAVAPAEPAEAEAPLRAARKPKASTRTPAADEAAPAAAAAAAARMADGMQWWNALTQQFQQIAANALREAAPSRSAAAADQPAAGPQPAAPKGAAKKGAAKKAAAKRGAAKKTPAAKKKAAAAQKPSPAAGSAAREAAPPRNAGWLLPPAKPR